MVGHQRVAHEVDAHEAQHRQQQQHEIAQTQQRRLAPLSAIPPANQQQCRPQQPGQIGPRLARVNLPPRIDETQVQRQQRLVEIEPDGPAGSRQPRPEAVVAHIEQAGAYRPVVLEPQGDQPHDRRQGEKGRAPPRVSKLEPPAPPPGQAQQHQRQWRDRRLAQQRQHKRQQRKPIPAPSKAEGRGLRIGVSAQVAQQAQKVEGHRQRVLALGNPGHGLDVDGMHGKDRRGQPGAGNSESFQQPPQQHRAERVQQHIHQVIAQRVRPPQPPFQPQGRGGHREVIRRGGGEPQSGQAIGLEDQRIAPQERVIVPDKSGAPHRQVGDQSGNHEQRAQEPTPGQPGAHRSGR